LHIELDLWGATELVVARLESARPALLLIDTDLLGCPVDLCTFARSLQPGVKVFGLVNHWSEREEGLHACADGFLHKPARDAEWKAVLRRFGVRDAHIAGGQSFTASSQDGAERPADQLRSALSDTPSQYCDKGDGRKKHSKEVQ
jgi:DNA-binding response OmpR family regulator